MSDACTGYGVSYIAEAPQEFKIGDRVEVMDASDSFERRFLHRQGRIANPTTPDGSNPYPDKVWVDFNGEQIFYFCPDQLRKLPDTSNPMDRQVGGSHYKKCKIEPAEYIHANGLDFFQGNVVKYITRFRDKDGKKDLEKIKHYCDMLIQLEYPE